MQCRRCETTNPDDNAFCEGCGTPIGGSAPAPKVDACSCGTPLSEMDADGFCGGCGRRLKRPDSDHIEIELLPDFAGVSDRGLRHNRNEDRFAIHCENGKYALVVCDGVSMSPDADEAAVAASQAAIQEMKALLAKPDASAKEIVHSAVEHAASAVGELAKGKSESPSSTIVAALLIENHLAVAWLGDSRAYWLSGTEAAQVTRDHSWQNSPAAREAGADAHKIANSHALVRWVGADAGDLEPEIVELDLKPPGLLLLCSDGLWNYAAEEPAMAELVGGANLAGTSALAVARELVEFARSKGGHDNITAIVLRHPVSEDQKHGG